MIKSDLYTPSPPSSPSFTPVDSSPPSSPSLHTISTPPASPGAHDPFAGSTKSSKRPRIYEKHDSRRTAIDLEPCSFDMPGEALAKPLHSDDTTPTRVVDPFSASAKRAWRPPTYEKKKRRVLSDESATSASSSLSYTYGTPRNASPTPANRGLSIDLDTDDDLVLSEEEYDRPEGNSERVSKEELEHRLWDEAITAAIDKVNGVIDLSGTSLNKGPISHIPSSIADLEGFVVLPPTQASSSAPSSPKQSPKLIPSQSLSSDPPTSSRQFTRATTLPAAAFNDAFFLKSKDSERLRGTPAARAASLQSVAQPTTQLRRREIHVFLANNSITRLPAELFRVSSLTVLSLRSNALTTVPPQIAQLTSLHELNLAHNKLRWLPAEMVNMRLTKLSVAGNPWVAPPLENDIAPSSPLRRQRPVSDTLIHFTVPPLSELCFRALFAPYTPGGLPHTSHDPPSPSHTPLDTNASACSQTRPVTVLEAAYALPLTEDLGFGPSVLGTLRSCVPAAVAKPPTTDHGQRPTGPSKMRRDDGQRDVHSLHGGDDEVGRSSAGPSSSSAALTHDDHDPPAISCCPAPAHRGQARTPVFVQPAEERWSWEEVIAGVRVGAEGVGGVGVPVRWRGCSRGCLAFLDPGPVPAAVTPGASGGPGPAETLVDGDGDVEMGGEEVEMQEVRFEGGLADPEDFEEVF